jgi:hypothetical protein
MEPQKKIDWSKFVNKPRAMEPIQLDDGHIGLLDEGMPLKCIYSDPSPLPHPHIAGQLIIHHKQCNTRCPAFGVSDRNFNSDKRPTIDVWLSCCGATIETEYQSEQMKLFL